MGAGRCRILKGPDKAEVLASWGEEKKDGKLTSRHLLDNLRAIATGGTADTDVLQHRQRKTAEDSSGQPAEAKDGDGGSGIGPHSVSLRLDGSDDRACAQCLPQIVGRIC